MELIKVAHHHISFLFICILESPGFQRSGIELKIKYFLIDSIFIKSVSSSLNDEHSKVKHCLWMYCSHAFAIFVFSFLPYLCLHMLSLKWLESRWQTSWHLTPKYFSMSPKNEDIILRKTTILYYTPESLYYTVIII